MFILIDKSKGISSFTAIKDFAKENKISKIGHTGTLDPLATGLLLLATDDDTKLIDYIDKGSKTYVAEMLLGSVSDTYDIEGQVVIKDKNTPQKKEIEKVLLSFIGEQKQTPPAFSAKKINGTSAYKLARKGEKINLKPSEIKIHNIFNIKVIKNIVSFEVEVSRGTYIRSLIHDAGQKMGCGAIMTNLRRTKIGELNLSQINEPLDIESIISIPTIDITKEQLDILLKGIQIQNDKKIKGIHAIKVNNIICGIITAGEKIKSIKLFGKKIDTI